MFARSLRWKLTAVVVASTLTSSCTPAPVGPVVRPPETTAASALGEVTCRAVGDRDQPLVVDWKSHERTNLEEAMRGGLAVVHYECGNFTLLRGCRVDGAYEFIATSKKEQVVKLADSDEVVSNLPLLGRSIASDASAGFARGSTLDLAMVLVGKRRTTLSSAAPDKLVGGKACEGATHFVHGAFVGAFALATGVRGEASTVARVIEASSKSEKLAQYRDGDTTRCTDTADAASPPNGCSAILRVELIGLSNPAETDAKLSSATCPEGLVFSSGKCAKKASVKHWRCAKKDPLECREQCELGDSESCTRLAVMYAEGEGVEKDDYASAKFFEKGCYGGDAGGCSGLGVFYNHGRGLPKNEDRALTLFQKACDAGEEGGCVNLGTVYGEQGPKKDFARAVSLFKRACDGGNAHGCYAYGFMYASERGVERDYLRAATLFKKACDGDSAIGCAELGLLYENADGVKRDYPKAATLFKKACDANFLPACLFLGTSYLHGSGVTKDEVAAGKLFARMCRRPDDDKEKAAEACWRLGSLIEAGHKEFPYEGSAADLYERACRGGEDEGCKASDRLRAAR